jgi:cytochrome c-type biogenesis protein
MLHLLAATSGNSVDTTVFAAFGVGFLSFVSPCVLPLVPGYLSAVSGVSITDLRDRDHPVAKVLWPAIIFCLSFTVMFVALGMTATGLGQTLNDHRATLDKVAGAMIIAMGVFFLLTPFVPKLNREWRPDKLIRKAGSGGPLIAGAAFAFAWTPCIGPTLSAILGVAATGSAAQGAFLLAVYSAGLAIPFLLTALAFSRMTTAFAVVKRHYAVIVAFGGAILIAMGILILTGELTRLNAEAQRLLSELGLEFWNL